MQADVDDNLRKTIRRAMSAPILTVEEEHALTEAWCVRGEKKALATLTETHMRMAVSAAIKFRGYGLPLSDLVQEGAIGLLEAARRFDPGREVRFCTYAGWWIRASMQDYILRNWSIVRVGSKSAHKTVFFNLSRIRSMIEEADKAPRLARVEAARKFKVTETDIEYMTSRLGRRDQSLNALLGEDGDAERQDLLPDERATPDLSCEENMDTARQRDVVRLALGRLSDRERLIINERFFSDEKVTLSALGTRLKLSKERVRQIEKQAMQKLRTSLADSPHRAVGAP